MHFQCATSIRLSGRLELDSRVQVVDRERETERRVVELDSLTFANVVQGPPIGAACDRHASGAVGNEEHDLERRQLFVVAELLSAVVLLGRAARHFDHDARTGDGLRVHQRHFSFSAHDGRIGERRQVGRFDANFRSLV